MDIIISKNTFLRNLYRSLREWYYLLSGKPRGLGYILMLHRIGEPDSFALPQNEDLKVTKKHLEEFIVQAKKEYDIIRSEQIPEWIKGKHKKKFLVFTFDDGYKEIVTEGLPLFQKYNIPFTVFLTASFAEQNALVWWYKLEKLILNSDTITLSNGNVYSLCTMEEKIEAFNSISSIIKKLDRDNFAEELSHLFAAYPIDWYENNEKECLNWDDVSLLLSYPLFTLGSHTYNHLQLDNLETEGDVKDEVRNAVKIIKDKTGCKASVFAYPYGGAGEREFKVMRSLQDDISLSVLVTEGPVTSNMTHLEQLPRVNLNNQLNINFLRHYRNVYMGVI